MNFVETRGNDGVKNQEVKFSEAILNPSASFGGLYVPKSLPNLDLESLNTLVNLSYKELTLKILELFEVDIDRADLEDAVSRYDKFDDADEPLPLTKISKNMFVSELYHGPTRAFKDMALQPFGHIISALAQKKGEEYLILAATSGDTGPATLDSFSDEKGVRVVCIYPEKGTSDVQRLQMVTSEGKNLKVIGIEGNFDDAQAALKSLLKSKSFNEKLAKKDIKLSAANSVNFGRIIFQIIYHIKSYLDLIAKNELKNGEKFYIIVPSGNFGNALGAYYAKKMGLPVEKIIIASNENNVLTQLINDGNYDIKDKELILTTSPAMDILKSSNVERILFDMFGGEKTRELMESLDKNGGYKLTSDELVELQKHFVATYSQEKKVKESIKKSIQNDDYIIDPHTATSIKAYEELREKNLKTVICSTAEWTKFATTVANTICDDNITDDLEALDFISSVLDVEIPQMILELFDKKIQHPLVINKNKIEDEIFRFLD